MQLRQGLKTALLLTSLVALGAGCLGGSASAPDQEHITLDYWRVFDDDHAFNKIITDYKAIHPNVTINYRVLRPEEYEEELIRAFAEGYGPDIFSVHNTQIAEFQSLMSPMPPSVKVDYLESVGTIRKEVVTVTREQPTISQKAIKDTFVDVVPGDVIRSYQYDPRQPAEQRIFGLPLSVDTLALYYNKDLLNAAGIAEPPATWEEFQQDVIKLTVIDAQGEVTQSGAALGTTNNVERSADLISVLMIQNGTLMTDDRGVVTFDDVPEGTPEGLFPAVDAIQFYTDFANPIKEVYTWNSGFPNSFEAFVNGQTAFYFGYSYHQPLIRAAAPRLHYATANLPQISGGRAVNYANYWVEGVAKNSPDQDYAWDFVNFLASADHVGDYLDIADRPTALRSLINEQLNSESLGVFAEQLLTAVSWYKGGDAAAMEKALNDFAANVLAGSDPVDAVEQAVRIVRQTY